MFQFFNGKKKRILGIILLFSFAISLSVGVFGFAKPAEAGKVMTGIKWVLGLGAAGTAAYLGYGAVEAVRKAVENFDAILIGLFKWLSDFFGGTVLRWLVPFMTKVAAYNSFLDAQAVSTGWVIVRDIGNMFFVLILLVIAIATILRVEAYSYKKLLPKLVLMAVLINFSKTICGIIIDFAQVIMLTFVNAFKAASAQNFWQTFGLHKLYSFESLEEQAAQHGEMDWDLTGAAFLAFLVIFISVLTMGVLTIFLIIRVAALWTLIILSPLAFLLASFPAGQKYASQWWEQFSKYVLVGPALAFFIWLALLVAGGGNANTQVGAEFAPGEYVPPASATDMADPNVLSSLVVGNVLLLVGLVFAQKLGIVGSGVAGAALSGLRRAGTAPARLAWRGAKWGVRKGVGLAWKGTKMGIGASWNKAAEMRYARTGKSLIFSKVNRDLKERRKKELYGDRVLRGQMAAGEKAAGARGMVSMAAVMWGDPSMRGKLGMWGTLRAIGQAGKGGKFADMAKRHGELARRKADLQRLQEDPTGEYEKSVKAELQSEKNLADASAKAAADKRKQRKEMEKDMSDGEKRDVAEVIRLDAQRVDLEGEISGYDRDIGAKRADEQRLGEEIGRYDQDIKGLTEERGEVERAGRGAGDREWDSLTARIGDLTKRRAEAIEGRRQAAESRMSKEELKVEAQKSLGENQTQKVQIMGRATFEVKETLKVHAAAERSEKEARGHKEQASSLEERLRRWGEATDDEKTRMAREHVSSLHRKLSSVNAALSTATPDLQRSLGRILEEAKAMLRQELGREPTDIEVNERVARVRG